MIKGILLIHGLMSSPVGMSSLQDYFEKQGYLVHSVLLPGHGTKPSDLLNVTYQDWLETCRSEIKTLRKNVDHLTVMGFSAGTTIAIYLALTEKSPETSIDNLVLFAPTLALSHPLIPLTSLFYALRNYSSRLNWIIKKEENDYAKYHSLPINAVYQINTLIQAIHRIKRPLIIPIYVVLTMDDETVNSQKAIHFFERQLNSLNRGIVYAKDSHKLTNLLSSLVRRKSNYPDKNILDFSHTCLAISPEHSHYGQNGDYADFGHYNKNTQEKLKDQPIYYGAVSRRNTRNYRLQRLSYNPDFDYLMKDLGDFLEIAGKK